VCLLFHLVECTGIADINMTLLIWQTNSQTDANDDPKTPKKGLLEFSFHP
jgi:hypothetical protein